MDYLKVLEISYEIAKTDECPPQSRLDFLGDAIFGFTTYDSAMSALLSEKAVEVCNAISNKTTFDYIQDPEQYKWYLVMCNMPFFYQRLTWGTSIRGAWWDVYPSKRFRLSSCFLFDDDGDQILDLDLDDAQWHDFIGAVIKFSEIA